MRDIYYTFRTLFRFKAYSFINIAGLTLSLAATLILVRYIYQEMTVNHFCKDYKQLCMLTIKGPLGTTMIMDNVNCNNDPNFVDPLAHPEVESYSRCIPFDNDYITMNNYRYDANVLVTDTMFLHIMEFPILSGVKNFTGPDDALITSRMAKRLFGNDNPLGKPFMSSTGNMLTVKGVIGEISGKSSLQFDVLASLELGGKNQWTHLGFCIAKLMPGTDINAYNKRISTPLSLSGWRGDIQFDLVPLSDFYFNRSIEYYTTIIQQGNYNHILILAVVAAMLLFIGLFNFVNIYTVVILRRAREFGVKKVYGVRSFQIFRQIYIENLYLSAIALFLVWLLVEVVSPLLAMKYDMPVQANMQFDILVSIIILFGLPFITSIYPYLRYYYSSPITSLRSVNVGGNSVVSRVAFLFVQYVITFSLILIALYFVRQLQTMLHTDMKYNTKDIIQCRFLTNDIENRSFKSEEEWNRSHNERRQKEQEIKRRMDECPLFVHWVYGDPPIQLDPMGIAFENKNGEKHSMAFMSIDNTYMDLFGFRLKEGRRWNHTDQWAQYKVIINETAQKLFGITDIHTELLQPEMRLWYSKEVNDKNPPYEIVGVIKDFRTGHLSKKNLPVAIFYDPDGSPTYPLLASIVPGKRKEAIEFLNKLHDEVIGEGDFNYTFVEDEVAKMYDDDRRTTLIYVTFAGLAILISCLGLFGLSLYDMRQRYREIALRKINGASVRNIFFLLIRKYIYILGGAFVVAIPLSYYIIYEYTKEFEVRSSMGIDLLLISLFSTLFVSLGTLMWQVRKAVRMNPADVLKSE